MNANPATATPAASDYASLATHNLFGRRPYWAKRFGIAPFLPMSPEEMDLLGWDCCDIILVTGDAYIDHPSFGMALIGRLLENQGFRVGIIAQPDWHNPAAFQGLGKPNLMFGVTGGNMDSMVNRYTSDRKIRHDDAYTPDAKADQRPDRAVIVYAQRCRQAYPGVPIVLGGIESSLRRIAHYDYWSDQVRRSILLDAKADLLVFGNGERQVVEIAHRLAAGETPADLTDIRGTAYCCKQIPADWYQIDSTELDTPGVVIAPPSPYTQTTAQSCATAEPSPEPVVALKPQHCPLAQTVIRLPAYQAVKQDPVLYAHTSRILHLESNPGNARALIQAHDQREVWLNPPALPLTTAEMDQVYELPYARQPHPRYGTAKIPAYDMIRFSITLMRGCFGGCTFCSITEHEGRIIQSRSEQSVINEIEAIREVPGFTGVISDLGGPTANMYRLNCKSDTIRDHCRRLSCVYPKICSNLKTDHSALIQLYRRARQVKGIKRILIASGLRYDLALESPEYIKELVTHHVGGYLKIAPEHTESGPLSAMMKPGIGTYDRFKALFDQYSKEAGKEQYLIPYFIAAHPGTTDADMLQLALWLKKNGFRADQVQAFLPSPMALATAMYYSGKNPLHKVSHHSAEVTIPRQSKTRRLHKALLRYHDPDNWPLLRDALTRMGRRDLIGNGKQHLIPTWQPKGTGFIPDKAVKTTVDNGPKPQLFRTQHSRPVKKRR